MPVNTLRTVSGEAEQAQFSEAALADSGSGRDRFEVGIHRNEDRFVGFCNRRDEHIPVVRVEASAKILEKIGAKVTLEIYDGLGHAIHERGFRYLESLLQDEKQ